MAKLTYRDLITMAASGDANERKHGFQLFQRWVRLAPKLSSEDRLGHTQRDILAQMFEQKNLMSAERQRQIAAKKRQR